jgi:phage N-6-adenine-methyltransferase
LQQLRQQLALKVYHQSKRHDWETPWPVFREYDAEFHFTLDVCATAETAKCARYFTPDMDGLTQDWGDDMCWMNPPYGREIGQWMEKAYRSSLAGATVVCLVPSRTGTTWWHTWVRGKAEVRERQGRITFVGGAQSSRVRFRRSDLSAAVLLATSHSSLTPATRPRHKGSGHFRAILYAKA